VASRLRNESRVRPLQDFRNRARAYIAQLKGEFIFAIVGFAFLDCVKTVAGFNIESQSAVSGFQKLLFIIKVAWPARSACSIVVYATAFHLGRYAWRKHKKTEPKQKGHRDSHCIPHFTPPLVSQSLDTCLNTCPYNQIDGLIWL